MARPLRIAFPGAIYHVTTRGNARNAIFTNDGDRMLFLASLGETIQRCGWLCHAYCLMGNHYHLLIETPYANLSQGMHQLNGAYTLRFNLRHEHAGHVIQGRFKAILVERDSHLLKLCRYVVLNPVRAGMVTAPADYIWSSYLATTGRVTGEPWLSKQWLLSQFGSRPDRARRHYERFVMAGLGLPAPWNKLQGKLLLGSQEFAELVSGHAQASREEKEIPRVQRLVARPGLPAIFRHGAISAKATRDALVRDAYWTHQYTMKAIAAHLRLHSSTISKIINDAR